ncbi:MAG: hypothetical protein ACOCTT_00600 [archaeon]
MNRIICDSSSLISLGNICALGILPYLEEKHNIEFIIPKSIEDEIVKKPMNTKKFKLKAIKFKELIKQNTLQVESIEKAKKESKEIIKISNNLLLSKKEQKPIEIIHEGEARTISLLNTLNISNLLIDERTTRLLIEDIEKLRRYIESQSKIKIDIDKEKKREIKKKTKNLNVIRSSEIIAIAYEEGYFPEKTEELLEGSLYASKFAGCGISSQEIKDYLHILEGKK